MKKKYLYIFTLLFIAGFPFGNTCYKVFRGVSVFFFHHFEKSAPFVVKLPPPFQKYISFYLTDFWIIALFIGALFLKEIRVKELFFNRHSRYLTLYTIAAALSIAFSLFASYYFQYVTLINLTIAFIAFHLIYLLFKKEKQWISYALWMFIAIAAFECVIGSGQFLMQKSLGLRWLSELQLNPTTANIAAYPLTEKNRFFFDRLPWIGQEHYQILRTYGTFEHPNVFGGYLLISLFVSYYLFITSKKKWQRALLSAFIPFSIFALALTFSRGSFFAWILGTIVFFTVSLFHRNLYTKKEKKQCLKLSGSIAGGLLLAITLLFEQLAVRGGFVNYNTLSGASDSGRILYYKLAASLFLHRPFLGIGHNGFALFPYEKIDETLAYANPSGELSHNIYLQIASETGLVGICLFLLFLFSIIRPLLKAKLTPLTLTLTTILSSLLLIGMIDHFLWAYPAGRLMLFIFSALLAASTSLSTEHPQENKEYQKYPM